MSPLVLITSALVFGGLAAAIDSDDITWFKSRPIKSGLQKLSDGKDIDERSNTDFATMIAKKILPFCDNKALFNEFILKGDANYACWCGAGTVNAKMFKPQNILDRVCRAHDICYDTVHDMGCHEPYDVDYDWGISSSRKITCKDYHEDGVKQEKCRKGYCECDKIMVDTVYKEVTQNGVECPTEDSTCATRAFTVLENSFCKGTYGSKYSSLDKAQRLCESDARCFGVRDNNYGQHNVDESKRYQRCTVDKNKERYTSVSKRAVYVKDTNMNCKCSGSAPWTIGDNTGKTCEDSTSKGFAGEPFCWIKSSEKHACTDAQRDNAQAEAGTLGSGSNWYYSTMPCITPSKPWADAYRCPSGERSIAFQGRLGYLRDTAKCKCQTACDKDSGCHFANLYYTHSGASMTCRLMGSESECGDWRNTRHMKYYLYQKDESGETERCYCEHENGENSNNGIMCQKDSGTVEQFAHCASDETCTGPTSSEKCNEWVLKSKRGDLCTPPSVLDQLISSIPWTGK